MSTKEQSESTGKGRPTPKRREAERKNQGGILGGRPVGASANETKEQKAARKAAEREARRDARERAFLGEEKYLLPYHQGAEKRWARDYVDARRTYGEVVMMVVMSVALISVLGSLVGQQWMSTLSFPPLMLAMMSVLGWGIYFSRRVRSEAEQKFPNKDVRRLGRYAAMRAVQLRFTRNPRPAVRVGGSKR